MDNNIKAIIFDWGGVCCKEAEPFASTALQQALGLSPDGITEKVKDIHRDYYSGKYSRDSFWRAILDHLHLKETAEINITALSDAYVHSYEVYQDVLDFIVQLRPTYRIGLLSNLTPEMKGHIQENHNLSTYFDLEIYSCDPDVQTKKPDPKMFRVMLEKLNLEPEECVFIDDSPQNIKAAVDIGMKTLLFKDRNQFFNDINKCIIYTVK